MTKENVPPSNKKKELLYSEGTGITAHYCNYCIPVTITVV
jgi:hypothetical protein